MAVDATGTPTTTLGIPKYNTAADIPSGKGFNAAMDYIDDLLEARAATPAGIASGEAMVWNGTTWVRSSVTRLGATSVIPAGRGTTLPATPYDGQEYVLVDSLTVPTYAWRFRYSPESTSAYEWEFIGGAAVDHEVATDQSTASTTYVDLGTVGPTVVVPREGDYNVSWGSAAYVTDGAAVYPAVKIGAVATSDADSAVLSLAAAEAGLTRRTSREKLFTGVAAGSEVKMQYKTSAGTANFYDRWLRVTPIRVN